MNTSMTPVWEKCVLCQLNKLNEPLKCPANDNNVKACKTDEEKKSQLKDTYVPVVENVFKLQ